MEDLILKRISGKNRNRKCYCGSGKKYKKCHYIIDSENNEKFKENYFNNLIKNANRRNP